MTLFLERITVLKKASDIFEGRSQNQTEYPLFAVPTNIKIFYFPKTLYHL